MQPIIDMLLFDTMTPVIRSHTKNEVIILVTHFSCLVDLTGPTSV